MENEISVGQYTRQVKSLLEAEMAPCWVRGEISNLRRQASGHHYFTLKDAASQVSCVMFRGDVLRQLQPLKEGETVSVFGETSVYEPRGTYQLICRQAVSSGLGALQAQLEQLKQKLAAEGLFDSARKQSLPVLPKVVGFVTSPTGAALRDFVSVLRRRRWSGAVVVFPALVQGKGASDSIVRAIAAAQSVSQPKVDLLVVGRGGGSLEDLWCFNTEPVARAVAACRIPIISAVGHEIDTLLSDHAADVRAETPTAAAELVSSGQLALREQVAQLGLALRASASDELRAQQHALAVFEKRLALQSPKTSLEAHAQRVDELSARFQRNLLGELASQHTQIAGLTHRLQRQSPSRQLRLKQTQVSSLAASLRRHRAQALMQRKATLEQLGKRLVAAGLPSILRRGFVVVRDANGAFVPAKSKLSKDQCLAIDFHDGEVAVRVDAL